MMRVNLTRSQIKIKIFYLFWILLYLDVGLEKFDALRKKNNIYALSLHLLTYSIYICIFTSGSTSRIYKITFDYILILFCLNIVHLYNIVLILIANISSENARVYCTNNKGHIQNDDIREIAIIIYMNI